jgi:arylsulfatase A-like enzyme
VTPFLDQLAARGVRFERVLSTVSHTAPSHASMFTGLSPTRHGLRRNGEALTDATPTLAGAFQAAGWDTAAFTSVEFLRGVANGFETVSAEWRTGGPVTRDAIAWLSGRDTSRPFFLWVHYYDVHEWFRDLAPMEQRAAVQAVTKVPSDRLFDELASRHGWRTTSGPDSFQPFDWGLLPRKNKRIGIRPFRVESREQAIAWIDTYDAQLAKVDFEIRRLFEFIEQLRPKAPALWIVTSDHGEGLGGHGAYGHGQYVYDEQLRVPLILFASDGSLPVSTSDELVSLVDLAPSVVNLVGAPNRPPDPALEGVSFAAIAQGNGSDWVSRPVFVERRPVGKARREWGWKYDDMNAIQRGMQKYIRVEGGRDEFYDLASDPHELNNLIDQPLPARDELRDLLDAKLIWLREHAGEANEIEDRYVRELRALGYVR